MGATKSEHSILIFPEQIMSHFPNHTKLLKILKGLHKMIKTGPDACLALQLHDVNKN